MALSSGEILADMLIHGLAVVDTTGDMHHVKIRDFLKFPEPGEREPWPSGIWLGFGEGDDGGGAAIAGYQFGLCPFIVEVSAGQ